MMIMEVIAGHLWVKVVVAAALKVVITVQEALLLCPYSLERAEHSMTAISSHFRETKAADILKQMQHCGLTFIPLEETECLRLLKTLKPHFKFCHILSMLTACTRICML